METYMSLSGVERKWKYHDVERPQGVCYDCRLAYSKFADLSLPHDVWEKINPTHHKGAGLLCPNCICERLGVLNISGVKAAIWPAMSSNDRQALIEGLPEFEAALKAIDESGRVTADTLNLEFTV